ncbi:YjcZ family sporulation protein [Bacillus luteolus]|uniref:YjcZ family sporulation protein n=1 Tax=Litchfieldia luteola TaxID=682179 RepID=A0ABR9QJ20_9BACI|nr:YjcZ family sporulation protein [Cytobacillus luteolus]
MIMEAYVNAAPYMGANVNAAPVLGANVPPQPTMIAPSYGYTCPTPCNNTFVLIVVLFILLIIVGTCYYPKC